MIIDCQEMTDIVMQNNHHHIAGWQGFGQIPCGVGIFWHPGLLDCPAAIPNIDNPLRIDFFSQNRVRALVGMIVIFKDMFNAKLLKKGNPIFSNGNLCPPFCIFSPKEKPLHDK